MIATQVPPLTNDASTSLGWCIPRYIRVRATPSGTISSSVHQATFAPVRRDRSAISTAIPT
ncbi:hypothetical protein GCM10027614_52540 [Micromonospora vulcania]